MSTERLAALRPVLEARSATLQAVRRFFTDRGFVEVETPVRIPCPALELHLDAEPSGDRYLRTSPELHMKRLLAAGYPRIFQLGPCFRRGERGRWHQPEYTMLEWYRADAGYLDMLVDAKALIAEVLARLGRSPAVEGARGGLSLLPVWECLTVSEAFRAYAGWDPVLAFDADRFDLDLVEKVEPAFPSDRPMVLKDYPVEAAALARVRPGSPAVAERWELFAGGLELANAFAELTDPAEQRRRFEACAAERAALGREVYPMDEEFLAALEHGLPPCSGVALGVDRLVMLLAGAADIADVRAFCA